MNRHRAIFISDVHLGTFSCQADKLLEFLWHNEAETIYLVGDIVDMWSLRFKWYWPSKHSDVIQRILSKAKKSKVIYIPGNHDEGLRQYIGLNVGGIDIKEHDYHVSATGKRYLVIHGDLYDAVITHAKWLAYVGDRAYTFALYLNKFVDLVRKTFGFPYWSLSQWAKLKVKMAVGFIGDYEKTLVYEGIKHKVDGIICGHIHHGTIHDDYGLTYINCGDWVESLTAVVEDFNGNFSLVRMI